MKTLSELQHDFTASIYDTSQPMPLIEENGISVEARLSVYRHNVMINLTNALKLCYPVIMRLVGEAFFDHAAMQYITAHPATSGNLDDYGSEFGAFLKDFPPAKALIYLHDVAHLEWAVSRAACAADVLAIDKNALARVAPEDLENLHFTCNPAVSLVQSRFPIIRIWETNQPGYTGNTDINLDEGGCYGIVTRQRKDFSITVTSLTEADFYFLTTIMTSGRLYDAYEAAEQHDAEFDVGRAIQQYVIRDVLVGFAVVSSSAPS